MVSRARGGGCGLMERAQGNLLEFLYFHCGANYVGVYFCQNSANTENKSILFMEIISQ